VSLTRTQLFWMIFISEIVLLTYFALGPAIKLAHQNIWISFIIAGVGAIVGTILMIRVSLLYSNQSLIQYCQTILGKFLGKLIAFSYICYWFFIAIVLLRAQADFININLLKYTPFFIVVLLLIFLIIYANWQSGITSIGRCSEVIGPLLFIAGFLPLLLSVRHMDPSQLLPVYTDDKRSIFNGALFTFCFLGETSVIMMVITFIKDHQKLSFSILGAIGFGTLWGGLISVGVILIYGPIASGNMYHPQYMFMKSISVLNFIQNFDLIITFFTQFGIMIKLFYQFFISSYGISQLLNIKKQKLLTFVLATLLFLCVMLTMDINYQKYLNPWIFVVFNFLIPLLLWIIGRLRYSFNNIV